MKQVVDRIIIISCFMSGLVVCAGAQAGSLSFELDVNTGYNNNVFLQSDDPALDVDESEGKQADLQSQVAATANIEFWDQPNSDASIMLDYFKESLLDNALDTQVTTLSLPMHYYHGEYRYGVTFTQQTYHLSGVNVLDYFISKLGAAKNLGEDKLFLTYTYTNKTPADDSYSDYEGFNTAASAKYTGWIGGHKWSLHANAFKNSYRGEGLSNTGAYLKAVYKIQHGRHTLSLGAKLKGTNYDLDMVINEQRADRQGSLNYNHEYFVSPAVQLYFDTGYIRNQSNIDYADENYNYDQWLHTLGTRFVF